MKKVINVVLAFLMIAVLAVPVSAAELVASTEKTELWRHINQAQGKSVACYWVQNRKGMADNVSTGLACVLLDRQYVVTEKVMEPHIHDGEGVF